MEADVVLNLPFTPRKLINRIKALAPAEIEKNLKSLEKQARRTQQYFELKELYHQFLKYLLALLIIIVLAAAVSHLVAMKFQNIIAAPEVQGPVTAALTDVPWREALDVVLRANGFGGLWLIGLWQRSEASRKIKQFAGNADAVASAYSLRDYVIAQDLGGEEAYRDLRTAVRFLAVDHQLELVQVTSPRPGDGKTTTAAMGATTAREVSAPMTPFPFGGASAVRLSGT